jgi:hypothetical protein
MKENGDRHQIYADLERAGVNLEEKQRADARERCHGGRPN